MENNNLANLWQSPQRQAPAAIFILIGSTAIHLIKGFWPVLAIYFFRGEKEESWTLLPAVIGFGVLSIVGAVVGYWFKKFHINNDTFVIQSGWLKKKTLSIPIHTIQAVHLEQNLWQQFFGVARVSFDSVGSDEIEAKLDALAIAKAEQLRQLLMERKTANSTGVDELIQEDPPQLAYTLSFGDLMKLSLTANHLEAFFILVALLVNILDEIKQIFGGNDYIDSFGKSVLGQTTFVLTFLVVAVVGTSLLFSIVRTMIKYYGFQLIDADQRWILSYGLFEKAKKIVPLNKVQILHWKANWLRRKIDYWTVQLQSVGHKQNQKNNIHVPVVSFENVVQLVGGYQPYEGFGDERSLMISPAYWIRNASRRSVVLTVIPAFILYFWFGNSALAVFLFYPFLVWNDFEWYRNFRWHTNDVGIQIHSGVFGRKFSLLNWKKIQQVHLHQNLYQRNKGLASIVFVTAGGKLTLPYISLTQAHRLVDEVLYEVESKTENWM